MGKRNKLVNDLIEELEVIANKNHFDESLSCNKVIYHEETNCLSIEKKQLTNDNITDLINFRDKHNLKLVISALPVEDICYVEYFLNF